MNAKCRVQNGKVKMKEEKPRPKTMPAFCNLHFEILLLPCFFYVFIFARQAGV
jgi:hypothetical protein